MVNRLPVLWTSVAYAFRGGFLIRPLLIVVELGIAGAAAPRRPIRLDLAFEQMRHYAAAAAVAVAAVSLRRMLALGDLSSASIDPAARRRLRERGSRLMDGCASRLEEFGFARLRECFAQLEAGAS